MDHEDKSTGQSLLRRADEQANLQLSRDFQQLSLLLDWLWVGERADLDPVTFGRSHLGSYSKVDLVANWQFDEAFSAQLRVGNALDEDYEVVDGYNTLGRNGMLKLRYQF
jgi:vitamin B12 transporter